MVTLFLVTLVVVFKTLATVSILSKANCPDKLVPTPYETGGHTQFCFSLAAISLKVRLSDLAWTKDSRDTNKNESESEK